MVPVHIEREAESEIASARLVIEALRERGVRVWRTDLDGTVDVEMRDGHLFVRPAR